eukprot:CAMPEP_0180140628 /NCGR_PEP_ID=MMETSP0986-20121125/14359_1 /TAXON_ID=697907 /ORGANISM="non described non described, Strain CCMP2293" /LENGTH=115 /DNA_ID=CAMNT_0022083193 /DNA_START=188 /DNA_END=535 /DNA_ORIENTATION=+
MPLMLHARARGNAPPLRPRLGGERPQRPRPDAPANTASSASRRTAGQWQQGGRGERDSVPTSSSESRREVLASQAWVARCHLEGGSSMKVEPPTLGDTNSCSPGVRARVAPETFS